MTYCTNCGTPQEPGSRFCTSCGRQGSAAEPATRRLRGRLVAVVATLTLLLGVGGVTAWATLTHDPARPVPQVLSPLPDRPQAATSTSQVTSPPASVNSEDAARDQLTQQISLDRPQVVSELAEAWVPQLSSKRPGLVVDGVSYDYTDIVNDHYSLRPTHQARLVWSGDWSSFREGNFYVTVAAVPFSTSAEANAWCDRQGIDSANCFAKRLSTIARPDGSTVNR